MDFLNQSLKKNVLEADGNYLNTQGLDILEQYVESYSIRLETYQFLRDQSKNLVIEALKYLFERYPELLQKHKQRCAYDMSEVLRYIALSILRDDETFFMETLFSWLDTILVAHKKNQACAEVYRYLYQLVDKHLPSRCSVLVFPYLDKVAQVLESHV